MDKPGRRTWANKLTGLILMIAAFAPMVLAEGFPGTGDASAWSDALPHYNLGNRYLEKGRYEDAINKFSDAIALYAYDPDFYSNLGLAYCKTDNPQAAEKVFKTALSLNDKDWMLWSNLATSYIKQNKLKEAMEIFKQSLKRKPPVQEQANIKKDMADITKILTAQGQLAPKPTSLAAKPSPSKNKSKPATKAPLSPAVSPSGKTDKEALKDSGWDYVH